MIKSYQILVEDCASCDFCYDRGQEVFCTNMFPYRLVKNMWELPKWCPLDEYLDKNNTDNLELEVSNVDNTIYRESYLTRESFQAEIFRDVLATRGLTFELIKQYCRDHDPDEDGFPLALEEIVKCMAEYKKGEFIKEELEEIIEDAVLGFVITKEESKKFLDEMKGE